MNSAELFVLNRYAASELAGALLLGKMARKTQDPYLRRQLAWHCAEEARHATVWEDLLFRLKLKPIPIHDATKIGYFAYVDAITDMTDFLCFVHVYELRVPFHFGIHLAWTQNPDVKKVLSQLIREEGAHLSWIRNWLIEEKRKNPQKVKDSLKKFSEIERKAYEEDIHLLETLGEGGNVFASLLKTELPNYENPVNDEAFQ